MRISSSSSSRSSRIRGRGQCGEAEEQRNQSESTTRDHRLNHRGRGRDHRRRRRGIDHRKHAARGGALGGNCCSRGGCSGSSRANGCLRLGRAEHAQCHERIDRPWRSARRRTGEHRSSDESCRVPSNRTVPSHCLSLPRERNSAAEPLRTRMDETQVHSAGFISQSGFFATVQRGHTRCQRGCETTCRKDFSAVFRWFREAPPASSDRRDRRSTGTALQLAGPSACFSMRSVSSPLELPAVTAGAWGEHRAGALRNSPGLFCWRAV